MKNEEIIIIKLLDNISKNNVVPNQIKYRNTVYIFDKITKTYHDKNSNNFF